MKFRILTLFPEIFPGMLGFSLAGEALKKGLWNFETTDIKQFGTGKFPRVDDTPYGGGAGMVMRADIIQAALESNQKSEIRNQKLIYMSPRGKLLTQSYAAELAKLDEITILCGRFEGVDERVIEHYNIEEISVGDYILSSGEPAAMVLMDALVRLLPNVVGNKETHSEESFTNGLLEYPHYTRPATWQGRAVPEVLTSGDHAKIAKWRLDKSREITKKRRPDLVSD